MRPGIAQLLKGSGPGRVSHAISLIYSPQPRLKHPVLGGGGEELLRGGVLGGDVSLQGVCRCEKLKASSSRDRRRRSVCPLWPGKWCSTAGTVHGARQQARVTGHATVWQNGPWGVINRSGHCVHKASDLACSSVQMLSLLLEIKARGGSLQCTSPWGTFVQRFRDLLSLNNTLWSQTIHEQHPHLWMAQNYSSSGTEGRRRGAAVWLPPNNLCVCCWLPAVMCWIGIQPVCFCL